MRAKKLTGEVITNVLAIFVSLVTLIPLLLIIVNALKTKNEAVGMTLALPASIMWENFGVAIERGKLLPSFFNSALYSVGSVSICCLLAAMAAFVLSRNRTRTNKFLYFFIVLGIAMPINYVALTQVMRILGLYDNRLGVILLYVATQMPFSVFLIYGFVGGIPRELDEAAVIDGAGPVRLFFSIILPLLKPAVATAAVLMFLNTWNEFISPLYFLSSSAKWPMTLSVYNFFGMYYKDWNLVCADILLTSLPVVLVYILGQKYIVSGMVSGAVKG